MKTILLTLLPILLLAQPPSRQSRFLDYEPDAENTVLKLRDTLLADGTIIFAEPALKLIALYADSTERLDRAEQLIRKYYKPKPIPGDSSANIELYLYVIEARETNEPSRTIPALNPVLAQLKQLTPYQSFRTIDTVVVRTQHRLAFEAQGALPIAETNESTTTTYSFQGEVRFDNSLIQLNKLRVGGAMPYRDLEGKQGFRGFNIATTINFKPGQFAVIGKTNYTANNGALILVVTGRVVD